MYEDPDLLEQHRLDHTYRHSEGSLSIEPEWTLANGNERQAVTKTLITVAIVLMALAVSVAGGLPKSRSLENAQPQSFLEWSGLIRAN